MASLPSLSVLVPCRNAAETIDLALESILQQELEELEVVVLDDASTDATPEILADWARREARLRVVSLLEVQGVGTLRNLGLAEARGDYVAFVDADDWVHRSFHRSLLSTAARGDFDFLRCGHVRVRGLEREPYAAPPVAAEEALWAGQEDSPVDYRFSWAGVYRRQFLRERGVTFQPIPSAEDLAFLWHLFTVPARYEVVSEQGYFYRRELATSLTRVGDERQLAYLDALRWLLDQPVTRAWPCPWVAKAYLQTIQLCAHHQAASRRLGPELRMRQLDEAGRLLSRLVDDDALAKVEPVLTRRQVAYIRQAAPAWSQLRRLVTRRRIIPW